MKEHQKPEEMSELAEPILPSRLRYLRETHIDAVTGKLGLTQEELANILSVSVASIKKYESENAESSAIPGPDVVDKMCALYETELFYSHKKRHPVLIFREEQRKKNQVPPKQ